MALMPYGTNSQPFFFAGRYWPVGVHWGPWEMDRVRIRVVGNLKLPVEVSHAVDVLDHALTRATDDVKNHLFDRPCFVLATEQIGRASCREECRSRWSPYH